MPEVAIAATDLTGMDADAMLEDINYTIITDVQITERTKTYVRADNATTFRQGTSGTEIQASTETSNQVNLKFEGAKPLLEIQLK
ncbi:conjugal transfer protein TraT [Escherichia coli]|nr:conjugal transfer protein TraT [Escherichia coli]EJE7784093.1 conjugal transfer protein TraT [Escherichia coli]